MTSKTKRWIEAAKILTRNPDEKVLCPECAEEFLLVKDEPIDQTRFDRYLICPKCGKWNVITINSKNE